MTENNWAFGALKINAVILVYFGIMLGVDIYPQNVFFDHYTIIPPLGNIKSIAASGLEVFAVSDNCLVVFDKNDLHVKRTYAFGTTINIVAYDQWYDDLWITTTNGILRLSNSSGMTRLYAIQNEIKGVGVGIEYLYLEAGLKYQLDRANGAMKLISNYPANVKWFKIMSNADMRKYPLLNPYYFVDELKESQTPFVHYPISSLYDDGTNLFVGTSGYGLMKYNTVSWQKQRVIYGPVDARVRKVEKVGDALYFITPSGLSIYEPDSSAQWRYLRTVSDISNLITLGDNMIVSIDQRMATLSGTFMFPISDFKDKILTMTTDGSSIYVGTANGMYRLIGSSTEAIEFGPDKYAVHAVYSSKSGNIYVGGDFAFYKYDRSRESWSKVINRGIKDIVEVSGELYLLSTDNQLIRYRCDDENSGIDTDTLKPDTSWILLPYFNVYDIDTDNHFLYCASYAGVAYYNPQDQLYKTIYNLPRIKFNNVFIGGTNLIAVSDRDIFQLPIKYRD